MPMDFPFTLLTGDMRATVHYDPDMDPNPVLEIDREWWVRASWFVEGPAATYLGGTFNIQVVVESIGRGDEETVATKAIPVTNGVQTAPNHLEFSEWIQIPSRSTNPNPNQVINAPGTYMLMVVLTYQRPNGTTGRIAGFSEGPLIQFYVD